MHIVKSCLLLACVITCNLLFAKEKQEQVVLITGASRGIGLATAKILADSGYHVYAGVRNIPSSLPSPTNNLHFELLDVTDSSSIAAVVKKIIEVEGHIDILINNAGYGLGGPVECLTIDEIKDQMDVNFYGVIRLCQEVLPHMREQHSGHIINISSEQGTYGLPYGSAYTASKAALESFSEALSIELLPWNIKVSIVEPGFVSTNFTVKLGSKQVKANPYQPVMDSIAASIMDRDKTMDGPCQTPEEIAAFLLDVIEALEQQLRYQTSEAAKEMVSMKLKDLSGKEYTSKMKAVWQESDFPKEL